MRPAPARCDIRGPPRNAVSTGIEGGHWHFVHTLAGTVDQSAANGSAMRDCRLATHGQVRKRKKPRKSLNLQGFSSGGWYRD